MNHTHTTTEKPKERRKREERITEEEAGCAVTETRPLPMWERRSKTVMPGLRPQPPPWVPHHSGEKTQFPGSTAPSRWSKELRACEKRRPWQLSRTDAAALYGLLMKVEKAWHGNLTACAIAMVSKLGMISVLYYYCP